MHFLLNRWTQQLQALQVLWLAQKRVSAKVYHRLKSSIMFIIFLSSELDIMEDINLLDSCQALQVGC